MDGFKIASSNKDIGVGVNWEIFYVLYKVLCCSGVKPYESGWPTIKAYPVSCSISMVKLESKDGELNVILQFLLLIYLL